MTWQEVALIGRTEHPDFGVGDPCIIHVYESGEPSGWWWGKITGVNSDGTVSTEIDALRQGALALANANSDHGPALSHP